MKIMITDSKGDSISITIGDNGSFRELNKQPEKGHEMQMNLTNLQNEKESDLDRRILTCLSSNVNHYSENGLEKSAEKAHASNLKLLAEQVDSCLNQLQVEPGTERETNNPDIKVSISSESNGTSGSKSLCRLCAGRGNDMVYMFDRNEQYKNIIEKIEDCLPIMVTKTDTLPKEACRSCLEKLELCHNFHKTVSEAEKNFLILGGKIFYDSEKTTKYCQTISRDSRTSSSSTGDENGVDRTSATQDVLKSCYSAPNSPICAVDSEEERSFEKRNLDSKSNKFLNSGRKRIKGADISSREVDTGEQSDHSKMIRCLICGEGFQTVEKYRTHSGIHVSDGNYPCGLCDEIFTVEKDWNDHSTEHNEIKKFETRGESQHVCDKCGKKFITEARLEFHKNYHNPDAKPYHCEICDKILDSESVLYQHMKTVHGQCKEFRCNICGKQFRAQASVNAHQRKHRYVRSFECTICNKIFYSNDTLEMHKDTHSKPLISNEKNFSCLYCGKTFKQKLPLTVHIMSHTASETSTYDSGEKAKINKKEKTHQRRSDPIDKPYKCTVCERTFDHSARLREHASVHTGKRPYSCSLCDKSFKRANARKVHMVIHTGEKPYQCDMCGTNFRRAGDMRRHKKTQHSQNE